MQVILKPGEPLQIKYDIGDLIRVFATGKIETLKTIENGEYTTEEGGRYIGDDFELKTPIFQRLLEEAGLQAVVIHNSRNTVLGTLLVNRHVMTLKFGYFLQGKALDQYNQLVTIEDPTFVSTAKEVEEFLDSLNEPGAEPDFEPIAAKKEGEHCDECGEKYPDDATGHTGPFHKESCSLYSIKPEIGQLAPADVERLREKIEPVGAVTTTVAPQDLNTHPVYVAGGLYPRRGQDSVFLLVSPMVKGIMHPDLPYVVDETWMETLWRTTQHHAHIYRVPDNLSVDRPGLTLFRASHEAAAARVEAPGLPRLSADQVTLIQAAIRKGAVLSFKKGDVT